MGIIDKIKKGKTKKDTEEKVTKKEMLPKAENELKKRGILKHPHMSEKAHDMNIKNQYEFVIETTANKNEVKKQVETQFNVKVVKVNVISKKAKTKHWRSRMSRGENIKRAIVTLKKGDKIDIFTS